VTASGVGFTYAEITANRDVVLFWRLP